MPIKRAILYAISPDTNEASKTSCAILPINKTSTPKTAPAIGAPNTEANPLLIPHITNFFWSSSENRNKSANIEARPAPIWALGPSFPTEPPAAIVVIVDRSLTGTTSGFILPLFCELLQ